MLGGQDAKVNEILAKHSGKSVDVIAKDSDRDNFMSAEEARKYGLVDEVVAERAEPAKTPRSKKK